MRSSTYVYIYIYIHMLSVQQSADVSLAEAITYIYICRLCRPSSPALLAAIAPKQKQLAP